MLTREDGQVMPAAQPRELPGSKLKVRLHEGNMW